MPPIYHHAAARLEPPNNLCKVLTREDICSIDRQNHISHLNTRSGSWSAIRQRCDRYTVVPNVRISFQSHSNRTFLLMLRCFRFHDLTVDTDVVPRLHVPATAVF